MSTSGFLPTGTEGSRITIDEADEEVHKGTRYTLLFYETISATSGTSIVALTTNSAKQNHIVVGVESDKAGLWEMLEGVTISGGSALTALNNNRNSTNTCDCTIVSNPSVGTVATIIGYHVIGSATGGASKSGGGAVMRNEWMLKPDTTYVWRFTTASPTCQVVTGLYFHEGYI